MNMNLWVQRWWSHLPPQAQQEFMRIIQPHDYIRTEHTDKSESAVEAEIRLTAAKEYRSPLWRNNNGAALMVDPRRPNEEPRHVRFGLGNTSKRVNDAWKSSDEIGITPVLVTAAHVGSVLGVFTAIEAKTPGWKLTKGDKRGQAQNNFMTAVKTYGGYAGFAQSVDDYRRIIQNGRPQK